MPMEALRIFETGVLRMRCRRCKRRKPLMNRKIPAQIPMTHQAMGRTSLERSNRVERITGWSVGDLGNPPVSRLAEGVGWWQLKRVESAYVGNGSPRSHVGWSWALLRLAALVWTAEAAVPTFHWAWRRRFRRR